jgi:hypothetical protein
VPFILEDGEIIGRLVHEPLTEGFSATSTLDTNDFGLKDLILMEIGPKLDFSIEVEATN